MSYPMPLDLPPKNESIFMVEVTGFEPANYSVFYATHKINVSIMMKLPENWNISTKKQKPLEF